MSWSANTDARTTLLGNHDTWFPLKQPEDIRTYPLDVSSRILLANDSLVSVSASAKPSGTGEIQITSITVVGTVVTLGLMGGVAGRDYTLKLISSTASGQVFTYEVGLLVNPERAWLYPPTPPSTGFGGAVSWASTGMPIGIYGVTTYGGSVYA